MPSSFLDSLSQLSGVNAISLEPSAGGTSMPSALGGLQVDGLLEVSQRLHRRLGWGGTLENAIDVARCASKEIDLINPVRRWHA